jgi:malonyl-CoA O-methyltransferase
MSSILLPDSSKQSIAQTFGQASHHYHTHAQLQKDCAIEFLSQLDQQLDQLPPGSILEVGCGTGFITQGLIQRFPERSLDITDLSAEMVAYCQQTVKSRHHAALTFKQMDGEQLPDQTYAMIISGFVIQWFNDCAIALQRMLDHLAPGGLLCLSFPSDQSFPEWRQICRELDLPMTANPLPNVERLKDKLCSGQGSEQGSEQVIVLHESERRVPTVHPDAIAFFRALKLIGAGLNLNAQSLSPQQMRKLVSNWNGRSPGQIQVHHHIVYLILRKKGTTQAV